MIRFLLILFLSVSWLWSQDYEISNDLFNNLRSSQDYFKKSSHSNHMLYYNTQIRKKHIFYNSRNDVFIKKEVQGDLLNKNAFNKVINSVPKKTVNKFQKKEAIGSKEKSNFFSKKPLLDDSEPKKKKNQNISKNSKSNFLNLFEDKIIFGLGFDTNKPLITCKIGYFLNRHLLVGGNFSGFISNDYHPANAGYYSVDVDDLDGDGDITDFINTGSHEGYTLTDSKREFGVFTRLYTLDNFFIEVDITQNMSDDDVWRPVSFFDVVSGSFVTENMVNRIRRNSTNLGFGIGYPIVESIWKFKLSFEPFIKLDIILYGKQRDLSSSQSYTISGNKAVGGLNILFLF